MSSSISINGLRIEMRENGTIYVNGRQYGPIDGSPVEPVDSGDRTLTLDKDGRVVGDVHGNLDVQASVPVTLIIEGRVGGSVSCTGDVRCERVGGSANAGRDIVTDRIGGSANAGRDIRRG